MLYYSSGWFECVGHGIMLEIVFFPRQHTALIIVLQYSYGKSFTAILRIVLCGAFVGREYNIHMSVPQWGMHFTFYTALQPHTIVNVIITITITPSFPPHVMYLSFHFLIYKSSNFI